MSARCNSRSEHGSSSRSGNTADPATVPDQAETLCRSFSLRRLVLIGDRGMLTDARVEDPRPYPGLGWISALRSDPLRRLVEEGTLQPSLFDATNLAARRKHRREDLLRSTEQEFQRIQREIERRTRKPLTATGIAVKVGRVRNRFKMAKHFRTRIEDSRKDRDLKGFGKPAPATHRTTHGNPRYFGHALVSGHFKVLKCDYYHG